MKSIQAKRGLKLINTDDAAPISMKEIGEIQKQVNAAYRRKFGRGIRWGNGKEKRGVA